nr:hypothetical protein [Tanacetum cinerariifolium]
MARHKEMYIILSHTKKIFANMRRIEAGFSGVITPLFDTMMVQAAVDIGDTLVETQQTPIVDQPSTSRSQKKQKPRRKHRKEAESTKPKVVVQEQEVSTTILAAATTVTIVVPTRRAKEVNSLLAERLQAREREEFFEVQKARLLVELIEKGKKHFAALRAQEKRNKPPIKAQMRSQICTYLRNMGGYKHSHLKGRSNDKIKKLFNKEMRKKQKVDENVKPVINDTKELKKCMEIVPDDGDEVQIEATPLYSRSPTIIDYKIHKEGKKTYFKIIRLDSNSQVYQTFEKMFKNFNREDLEGPWGIVKDRFKKETPVDDMDNLLFKTLKAMFEHHVEDSTIYYLLVEKVYPLTRNTLHQLWSDVRLQVDHDAEMAYDLLKFIRKQITEECEIRYHPSKANVVADALSRKERVKPRRVRAMAMTIQSGVKRMILASQSEAFKEEYKAEERLHGYSVHPRADKMYHDLWNMYWCLVEGMARHKEMYIILSHTKKIFANMRRIEAGFSGVITPLFDTMMVQAAVDIGDTLVETQQTPIVDQPSTSRSQKKQKPRRKHRKEAEVYHDKSEDEDHVP